MVFWLWTPLFLVEMGASIYHEGVQNAKCKDENLTPGSKYHMLFKLLVPRGCWLKRNIIEKSSYKWRFIFFWHWFTYKPIYKCCWRETKHMTLMGVVLFRWIGLTFLRYIYIFIYWFLLSNTEHINCTAILPAVLLWIPPMTSITYRCYTPMC